MIAALKKIKNIISLPISKLLNRKVAEVVEAKKEVIEEKVEVVAPAKKPGRPKSTAAKKTVTKKAAAPKTK